MQTLSGDGVWINLQEFDSIMHSGCASCLEPLDDSDFSIALVADNANEAVCGGCSRNLAKVYNLN